MKDKCFQKIFLDTIKKCKKTLIAKGGEYSRNGDRLWNFKRAARFNNNTPIEALWGMALKHLVSIDDIIDKTKMNEFPSDEVLDEKIGDMINYLILAKAIIIEKRIQLENTKKAMKKLGE